MIEIKLPCTIGTRVKIKSCGNMEFVVTQFEVKGYSTPVENMTITPRVFMEVSAIDGEANRIYLIRCPENGELPECVEIVP